MIETSLGTKRWCVSFLSVIWSVSDGDDIFNLEQQQAVASLIVIPLLSIIDFSPHIVTNAILRFICINQDFKKRLHDAHYTWGTAGT